LKKIRLTNSGKSLILISPFFKRNGIPPIEEVKVKVKFGLEQTMKSQTEK
jgi:hypothetical protein